MKRIDWNEAGRQGLIERINTEILHPLGLAMFRTPEDGVSPGLLIAEDGKWEYAQGTPGILPTVTAERDQLKAKVDALQERLNVADQRIDEMSNAASPAAREIIAERQRQIVTEGHKPDRDDCYSFGELALAAAGYAANAGGARITGRKLFRWDDVHWKPSTPRRDLVKAGALILAEIERLDRAALMAASCSVNS